MKRTTKTHPKYPGRIRPVGLGRQEIIEALTEVGERTPGIPMNYVIKSVFVGGKNPWEGIDVSQMRNKIGVSTTERAT